mmetsp:Transcript_12241/g.18960  ORF Transcript_12241/g.18960 Transcript_12241/m.18960 type:complete len:321 (+) Transcript_12241:2789-3751(+)
MTYVQLEITGLRESGDLEDSEGVADRELVVVAFPCLPELYHYMVPLALYRHKKALLEKALADNKFVGEPVRTYHSEKKFGGSLVKIANISPLEPDLYGSSDWETVSVVETNLPSDERNPRRGGRSEDDEVVRINFWDIIFPGEKESLGELCSTLMPSAFNTEETEKLVTQMTTCLKTKAMEFAVYYQERVPEILADDYRSFVAHEMYLNLVEKRLKQGYYRSKEALFGDISTIYQASEIYNGDTELTQFSKKMAEKLKQVLRLQINAFSASEAPPKVKTPKPVKEPLPKETVLGKRPRGRPRKHPLPPEDKKKVISIDID